MTDSVVKRDGSTEPFRLEKIQGHANWACEGLDADPNDLITQTLAAVYDGMPTSEIHQTMVLTASSMIDPEKPDYTNVAARLTLQEVYKDVTGGQISYPSVEQTITNGVEEGILDPRMAQLFDFAKLEAVIAPERDLLFDFLGIQTLSDRYLLRRRRVSGKTKPPIFELPQHLWMRVAMGLALKEDDPTARAIEFYGVLSRLEFVCSTPTLFNSGTMFSQLSSCYGSFVPDRIEGIFDLGFKENGMLSKFAGGIGTCWTAIRAAGSVIRSTNGTSAGVVPMIRIYNDVAVAFNQGGKRKGAFAPYLELWHADIEAFMELKKKTGDEHMRAHDVFPAIWANDLFFDRLDEDGYWSLFSPDEVPELMDAFGDEFNALYEAAEKAGKARKTIKAKTLWRHWLDMLYRTGAPWVTFKDESNRRNPQQHVGRVHNSNLCTEIILNNSEDETFVCNLGSVNLARVSQGPRLRSVVRTAMRMLDNVIDLNFYPTENARRSNLRHRPVGMGVMGYAEAMVRAGIDFESEDHLRWADRLFRELSFWATDASVSLAQERGAYETYEGSLWSQGIFTHETARKTSLPSAERVLYGTEADWERLRVRMRQFGIRNCNMLAIAPTATIANISATTECIQPIHDRITLKENLSGMFRVINPLARYKRPELVKTAWEIDQTWLVKAAAVRQRYLDQAQSLNLYKSQGMKGKDLDALYRLANRLALKTTYYLRVQKETGEVAPTPAADELEPVMCSIDNPDCESCQ